MLEDWGADCTVFSFVKSSKGRVRTLEKIVERDLMVNNIL